MSPAAQAVHVIRIFVARVGQSSIDRFSRGKDIIATAPKRYAKANAMSNTEGEVPWR